MAATYRPSDFESKGPWIVVTHKKDVSFRFKMPSKDDAQKLRDGLRIAARTFGLEIGYDDVRWACKLCGVTLPDRETTDA